MIRRIALTLLPLLYLVQTLPASAADDATCRRFTDTMLTRATTLLHDQSTSYPRKHEQLSALFQEAVDIPWVAARVAGPYWDGATPQQREEYVKAYRRFISDYYIGGLDEGDVNQIQAATLEEFSPAPGGYDAQVRLEQKDDDTIMIYLRLAQDDGSCHVHDFTVEGVSLLVSQADEIKSLGVSGGLSYITQQLVAHPPAQQQH